MQRAALVSSAGLLPLAAGHGNMVLPPSWQDADGSVGQTAGKQCFINCKDKDGNPVASPAACDRSEGLSPCTGCACDWYTNWTFTPGPPTIADDSPLRTWSSKMPYPPYDNHPWRAPGSAPVDSPCGVDGGNINGCGGGTKCAGGGYGYGPDARTLPGNTHPAQWAAGAAVDVAWALQANHGGGYAYRLCAKPAAGNAALTEECFRKGALPFVGDTQWIQYGTDTSTRKEIPAVRTSNGTVPAGSQWTRNPIPACKGITGGALPYCPGPQFPPPLPGLYGFTHIHGTTEPFGFSIVDKLQLPADLAPGAYVLSFRWDAEQTPQVWNSCADVQIS